MPGFVVAVWLFEITLMMSIIPRTCCFLQKKQAPAGLHHTESQSEDAATNCCTRIQTFKDPKVQISTYPDVQMSGYLDIWRFAIQERGAQMDAGDGDFQRSPGPDPKYVDNTRHIINEMVISRTVEIHTLSASAIGGLSSFWLLQEIVTE